MFFESKSAPRNGAKWLSRHPLHLRAAARAGTLLIMLAAVAGCAQYQPLPDTARSPATPAPPKQAWTLESATRYAFKHNPQLIESNTQLTLARQQAGLANVPPPMSLGFSLDHPWQQGLFNAFSLSVSQDLSYWLKQAPRKQATQARLRQAILNHRWQAWQLAAAVQQQYVTVWYQQKQLHLLQDQIQWVDQRITANAAAEQAGLITADTQALLLANGAQWQQMAHAANLQRIKNLAQLWQLLGLPADTALHLTKPPQPALSPQVINTSSITQRPDVLALKAAIDEQDAQYRQALIDQFPSISLGLTRAQDTSKVQTIGVGINLVLPSFDGNRHAISVAKTSRKLAAEQYQHRLLQIRSDFAALWQKQAELQCARKQIEANLPALRQRLNEAEQAMAQGLVNANTVDTLRQTVVNQRLALLQNTAARQRAGYALPALVGIDPAVLSSLTSSSNATANQSPTPTEH
jgi:outer membrane protein TolC